MPQGGFFGAPYTDWAHFKANTTDPDPYHGLGDWMANIDRYVPPAEEKCLANNASLGRECGSALHIYPYTTSPMFLLQASVDYEQVFAPSRRAVADACMERREGRG